MLDATGLLRLATPVAGALPRFQRDLARARREQSSGHRQRLRPAQIVDASKFMSERNSMQRKSVPLIKSADDDSGTFTGLASVFDDLDRRR